MRRSVLYATLAFLAFATLSAVAASAASVGMAFDVVIRGFRVGEVTLSGKNGPGEYRLQGFMGTKGFFGSFIATQYSGAVIGNRSGDRMVPRVFRGRFAQRRGYAQVDIRYGGGVPRSVVRTPDNPADPWDIPLSDASGAIDPISAMGLLLEDRAEGQLCTQAFRSFDGSRLSQVSLARRDNVPPGVMICDGAYVRLKGFPPQVMAERRAFPFTLRYQKVGNLWRVAEFSADTLWGQVRARRR